MNAEHLLKEAMVLIENDFELDHKVTNPDHPLGILHEKMQEYFGWEFKDTQTLFLWMMETSRDTIKSYSTDAYHDAVWLREHAQGSDPGLTFYWSYNDTGTSMGTCLESVTREDGKLFKITVHEDYYKVQRHENNRSDC